MSSYQRLASSTAIVIALVTVTAAGRESAAQKGQSGPKGITLVSEAAQFDDAAGIRSDGLGLYRDGVDGVSSQRVSGSSTTNGWAWDLAAKRTSVPRTLTYDLTHPADGVSQPMGVLTEHDTHGQVYDLSTMSDGQTAYVRASFHIIINRVEYVVRFGQTPGDGSAPLKVTRTGNQFWVRTDASDPNGDIARYVQGNGPGEVLVGLYHVPVDLTLSNQQ